MVVIALGRAPKDSGDIERACASLEEALNLYRAVGDLTGEGDTIAHLLGNTRKLGNCLVS
jgi:hypothetical protein